MVISLGLVAVGSAYVWGLIFGDIHGLKSLDDLNNSPEYPNANTGALIAAGLTSVGLFGWLFVYLPRHDGRPRYAKVGLYGTVAATGAIVLALTLLLR